MAITIPAFPMGKGLTVEIKGNQAIITVDLTGSYGVSPKGNPIVANSGGFVILPGTDVKLSVNAIKSK